ncbi:MAG: hypothetical protein ABSF38_01715 [Verrucomicrobiota bacterium]
MNPGKFVAGAAALLAFCLTSPVEGQIAGFGVNGTNWTLNMATNSQSAPVITNNVLIVGTNADDANTAFYDTPQYIGGFTASFVFKNAAETDDAGIAFVLQNEGVNAVGQVVYNDLGYVGLTSATGIAFDINPAGGGPGLGYAPVTVPGGGPNGYISTGAVNFRGTNAIAVNIVYAGYVTTVTVTDTVTKATFTTNFNADLSAAVGANTAYVGITGGGTGVLNVSVSNFVFNSVNPGGTATSGSLGFTNGTLTDVSKVKGNETDGVIALNPLQPSQLFIAGNTNAGFSPGLFSRYSTNAGSSWQPGALTNLPGGYDPAVAWDGYGNLFLAYADNSSGTDVAFSTNGGQSFTLLTNLATGDNTIEQRIAVGSGPALGSLWVLYYDYRLISIGSPLVAQGVQVNGLTNFGSFGPQEIIPGANIDCGFGDIAVGAGGQVMVAYQDNNDSTGSANIYVSVDPDGLGPEGFGAATLATDNGIGGNTLIPAAPDGQGLNSSVGLAWDTNPASQQYGRAYLVYTGQGSPTPYDLDIFMVTSDDAGATWSGQTRVNDDFTQNSKFMPRVALDPTDGAVAVSWYDCRNDNGPTILTNYTTLTNYEYETNGGGPIMTTTNVDITTNTNYEVVGTTNIIITNTTIDMAGTVDNQPNDDAEMFVTVSVDGGLSFASNEGMSTNPSESFLAQNYASGSDYGDYNGLAFYGGTFYPVWADNSEDFASANPDGPTNKFDIAVGSVAITGLADLSVTMGLTNTPNPLQLGSQVEYFLTVSNGGPSSAPATELTDVVSPFLNAIRGAPSVSSYTLSGNTLSWPVGTLAPAGSATLLIRGTVISSGNITNIASVESERVLDLFTNNNVFTLVTPDDSPNLVLTMIGSPPITGLGRPAVTYTMTVTNLQPVAATGVTLSDILPTNLSLTEVTVPPGATVSTNQNDYTFQLGALPVGQAFTVSMTAAGVAPGLATNSAVVYNTFLDPYTNNTASAVTQILTNYVAPAFALGITGLPTNIGGNQEVVYTFSVTNVGPVNVTNGGIVPSSNALLSIDLSTNLFYLGASLANESTSANPNIEVFDLGPLATNQTATMTLTAAGVAIGLATNTAVVTDNLGEGGFTNQVVTPIIPPVLTLTMTGTPSLIAIGQTVTNEVNITNVGTIPAYALTLAEVLSTNLALEGVTIQGVSGDLSTNQNTIGCEIHELDPGQFTSISFTSLGLSNGRATNSATLFANFSSNYTAQVVTPIDAPTMFLSMTGTPTSLPVGQPVTYNLSVENLGPVPAYGVIVTDALPAGLSLSGVTLTQGSYSNLLNVVYCNIGSMAMDQVVTLHITAIVQTAGSVSNTGYVSANSGPNPVPKDGHASVTTVITNAPQPYNLAVVPGVTSAFITWNTPYGATDQVEYGLTTTNESPSFLNTNLNTRHVVLLTGLLPDTNYYFQARSVTSGLLATTNGSFATVSSLTLGTGDAAYSAEDGAKWLADAAATGIYPTNIIGSDYYYTFGVTGNPTAWATYTPNIPTAGTYDVYIWYPGRPSVSSNTPVIITGSTNAVYASVNQTVNSGSWQLLAPSVYYASGTTGSVVIYNNSQDPTTSVLANAVRWSYDLSQDAPTNGSVPAWWANFYFGGSVSGSADEDGDGYSNYAEYVLGTDPTSASSFLQFSVTPGSQTNTVAFAPWQGGRLYQLLCSTNLHNGWQTLTNTASVTTNGTGVFNIKEPGATAVFYQLSVAISSP